MNPKKEEIRRIEKYARSHQFELAVLEIDVRKSLAVKLINKRSIGKPEQVKEQELDIIDAVTPGINFVRAARTCRFGI